MPTHAARVFIGVSLILVPASAEQTSEPDGDDGIEDARVLAIQRERGQREAGPREHFPVWTREKLAEQREQQRQQKQIEG